MSEFEGHIWTLQENDKLHLVCTVKPIKKKIQILNSKSREQSIAENKLGWKLAPQVASQDEWAQKLVQLEKNVRELQAEIDIELLWEAASEGASGDVGELAELYFGDDDEVLQRVAIWRTLARDKLHFKRKGAEWEIRPSDQVEELKIQRQREAEKLQKQQAAENWMREAMTAFNNNGELAVSEEALPFVTRLENWLRGDTDKEIFDILEKNASQLPLSERELAFDLLMLAKRLPEDSDRDVVVAGLRAEFSSNVLDHAHGIMHWIADPAETIHELDFSIDDEETREVDDALSIEKVEAGWLIKVGIADPSRVIESGDTLDREAIKRGTTVYLPTQVILMLPEHISCNIASLTAQKPRSTIITHITLTDEAEILDVSLSRSVAVVNQRLSYVEADELIENGTNETADKLRALADLGKKLAAQRKQAGSFGFNRPEYKIEVDAEQQVSIKMFTQNSASRALVAEMMIQTNALTARYAHQNEIPIIYRGQDTPTEPITDEMLEHPLAFYNVRKLIKPSSLSLQAIAHSGLGLSSYTQITSPLRRFADMVMQRQLVAHLDSNDYPYDQQELFQVLATAEQCSRGARRAENNAKRRWFLVYLQQQPKDRVYEAMVVDSLKSGYKVELLPWGTDALLGGASGLEHGQIINVKRDKVRLKALQARVKLA